MPDNAQLSSLPFSRGEKGDSRRKLTVTHLRELTNAGLGAITKGFRSRTGSRRVDRLDRFYLSHYPSPEEIVSRLVYFIAVMLALLLASGAAQAQEYPVKPIRIIVP